MPKVKVDGGEIEVPQAARALPAAALAALTLAAPVAAVAQDNRFTLPPGQARVVVAGYAECVVRQRRGDVRAALLAWSPGRGEPRLPVINDCGSVAYSTTEMSFPPATYRYAMAEALYAADYRNREPGSYDGLPLVPPPTVGLPDQPTPADRAAYEAAVAERYRLIIGDCVVRTAPPAAHALLTSRVESQTETAALAAIQPVLAQCLPSGQTVRFDRSSLRGILAIVALRLNAAAGAAAQPSGGAR